MFNLKNLLLSIVLLFTPPIALSAIIVSPVMATDAVLNNYVINPGSFQVIQLPSKGDPQDTFLIKINAANAIYKDITAYVVDQKNLSLYQNGYPFRGIGYQKAIAPFSIQGSTGTLGPKFLILDNRYAAIITKKINISIEAKFSLDSTEQEKIKSTFSQLYTNLKNSFIFPDFNIRVEPCGHGKCIF